ncbi:hypothetical protein QJS04_geneDACA003510 [Acorus gramineus]|uniref:Uncharacterized protein n=1 Tax=Acorus gramineus TaxID=55184 RepID=A0AAV9BM15_ACOGR|nr:hypothetical protein QJS04_geneDACA003510 [Acorus gramineus]
MDFLRDVGFSITDLTFVLSKNPAILACSIDDRLVPAYGFLKSILGTDEAVIFTTKRESWLLHKDHKMMGLRIQALRDQGVLDSGISALIKRKPRIFLTGHPDRFTEAVTKVKAMGFKPLSFLFYSALGTILSISESKWEEKFELYRSFGWSKDDILSALKKQPEIMLTSQDKIRKMMDFFSKEPGLGLSILSSYPHLLWRSLEKAIIPRYSVIHVLTSQGLLNKDVNFSVICSLKKEKFLEKYVIQYQDKVPQVLQAYRGKMAHNQSLGNGSNLTIREVDLRYRNFRIAVAPWQPSTRGEQFCPVYPQFDTGKVASYTMTLCSPLFSMPSADRQQLNPMWMKDEYPN